MNLHNLAKFRAERASGDFAREIRETLEKSVGPHVRPFLDTPESVAECEDFADACVAVLQAMSDFRGTDAHAEALSAAALAYRDANVRHQAWTLRMISLALDFDPPA